MEMYTMSSLGRVVLELPLMRQRTWHGNGAEFKFLNIYRIIMA